MREYFDGNEFEDDFDGEDFDETENHDIEMANFGLVEINLNQKLLFKTMDELGSSFWWKFKNTKTKLHLIEKVYKKLKSLIDNSEE